MGTADQMTQHLVVSRRRTHRRKPTLRRVHHWPTQQEAQASQLDIPSRFLTPISETRLAPRMALSATAGLVDVVMVIDANDPDTDAACRAHALRRPLAQRTRHYLSRASSIGRFYGIGFVAMGRLLLACLKKTGV